MGVPKPMPMILQMPFNNYFASIAETTKKTKYSHKHFVDYLSNESSSRYTISTTYWLKKKYLANISSLNSNKASGPNSVPYQNILFLLKNEISKQLVDLFNLSFMTGVSPSVLLKTAKVVPVFKKDSKLDYSNE